MGRASALYTFILENFWTTVGLKVLFYNSQYFRRFPNFVEYFFFNFIGNFTNKISKISLLVNVCYPQQFYILLDLVLKLPLNEFIKSNK